MNLKVAERRLFCFDEENHAAIYGSNGVSKNDTIKNIKDELAWRLNRKTDG